MKITCSSCNTTYNIKDPSKLGQAVKCPRCQAPIRLANKAEVDIDALLGNATTGSSPSGATPETSEVAQPTKPKPKVGWSIRVENDSFGPYTELDMIQYVSESRITADTDVSHPIATDGNWVNALSIPFLKSEIIKMTGDNNALPPEFPQSPTYSLSSGGQIDTGASAYPAYQTSSIDETSKQRGFFRFILDLLDPTFSRYVTPIIIWITWWLVLAQAALFIILFFVGLIISLLPASTWSSDEPRRPVPRSMPATDGILSDILGPLLGSVILVALAIVWFGLIILWCRVVLECLHVMFDINKTLKRIERSAR